MKLTDPLEERVIFDSREMELWVTRSGQLSWVGCLMVNNGCWDDGMTCHDDDAHACIMHASCNMHVHDMSMTCP